MYVELGFSVDIKICVWILIEEIYYRTWLFFSKNIYV